MEKIKKVERKSLTYLIGYFKAISPIEILSSEGRPDKKRATITFETEDGQVLFLEARGLVITRVEKQGFLSNDLIKVGIVFIGSEKKGRKYNNIFVNHIDYANKETEGTISE